MPHVTQTTRFTDLPPHAFGCADTSPDALFYTHPRMVTHIDARAVAGVRALYGRHLAPGMKVLDLMSSRHSHLPDMALQVRGHGMNAAELDANPALARRFVQDLNVDPVLPLHDDAFDAVLCCVSVQYLRRPLAAFREVARVLRPGGPFLVTFSNRCFPTKAIALWHATSLAERGGYVALAMTEAGLEEVAGRELIPEDGAGDPLWAVVGHGAGST